MEGGVTSSPSADAARPQTGEGGVAPGGGDAEAAGDAGTAGDAEAVSDAGALFEQDADAGLSSCDLGAAASYATDQSLDLFGQITYFASGKTLPAGPYRVAYVDGCMKYSSGQDWAVQAYADGHDAFWLVGQTSADKIIMPPGTVGFLVGSGGFATFDECVAANLMLPPVDFDFDGGVIGVWLQDNPYSDNVAGVDGRNPKWSLTFHGDCQQIR